MEDRIKCPNCGAEVNIPGRGRLGRKPLGIDVKNICDALASSRDVSLAAAQLGCSRGYIYGELKKVGTTPKGVIRTK
jgi:hypothetical protein